MKKFFTRIGEYIDLRDVVCAAGLAAVWYGASMIYLPAAWIVVGVALFWLAVR